MHTVFSEMEDAGLVDFKLNSFDIEPGAEGAAVNNGVRFTLAPMSFAVSVKLLGGSKVRPAVFANSREFGTKSEPSGVLPKTTAMIAGTLPNVSPVGKPIFEASPT